MINIYNGLLLSNKGHKLLIPATAWRNLKYIKLKENLDLKVIYVSFYTTF